ncbi:unnamed protein product [Rangifer tarandus platyrhynchus]|uniref:Uncharacterized protein n=1 Tax=Rangifer tarandus platyrhynchus TaxID=3082113 RepID=A0ACB1MJL7_RANTA
MQPEGSCSLRPGTGGPSAQNLSCQTTGRSWGLKMVHTVRVLGERLSHLENVSKAQRWPPPEVGPWVAVTMRRGTVSRGKRKQVWCCSNACGQAAGLRVYTLGRTHKKQRSGRRQAMSLPGEPSQITAPHEQTRFSAPSRAAVAVSHG